MKSEIGIEVDGGAMGDVVVCGLTLDEGFSTPYRAEVTVFSEQARSPARLRDEALGRRASVRIVEGVEKEGAVTRDLCGVITSVAHLGAKVRDAEVVSFCGTRKRRLSCFRFVIEPQLAELAFSRRTLDYPDTTPLGAVQAVLRRNRIEFDASGQYLDAEEYAGKVRFVQRDETDLAFVHRVMARYGISYTFTHVFGGRERMVLSSGGDYPSPSRLEFRGLDGYADAKEIAFSTEGFGRGAFGLVSFRAESGCGFSGLKNDFILPSQTKDVEKAAGDAGGVRTWLRNEAPAGYDADADDATIDKDFERFTKATRTAMRLAADDWRGETPHLAAMPGKVLRISGFVDGEDGDDEPVKARVTRAKLTVDLLRKDDDVFRVSFAAQDFADDLQEKRWVPGEGAECGTRNAENGSASGVRRTAPDLLEAVVCDRNGNAGDEKTVNTIVTSTHATAEMPWVFLVKNPNPGDDGNRVIDVAMTQPLGGRRAGLYHFPRVGERVFVMLTGDRAVLMGYVPDRTGSFGDFTEGADAWTRRATALRYTPPTREKPADGEYSEIGFSYAETAAEMIEQRIVDGTCSAYLQSLAIEMNNLACLNGIRGGESFKIEEMRRRYFAHPDAETAKELSAYALELAERYIVGQFPCASGVSLRMRSGGSIVQYAEDGIEITTPGSLRISARDVTINGSKQVNLQSEEVVRNSVGASTVSVNPNGVVARSRRVLDAPGEYDSSVVVGATDGVLVSGANVRLSGLFTASMNDSMGGAVQATNGELQCSGAAVDLATARRSTVTEAFEKLPETSGLDKINEVLEGWKAGRTPDGKPRSIADRGIQGAGLAAISSKVGLLPRGNFRGTLSGVAASGANLSDASGMAGMDAETDVDGGHPVSGASANLTVTQRELLRARAFADQMDAHRRTVEPILNSVVDGKSSSVTIHGHQLDLNVQFLHDLSEQKNTDAAAGGGAE